MSKHRRPAHGPRRSGLAAAALGVAVLTTLGASAPAMAAKGGGGGKPSGGGTSTSSSSLKLVLLNSTDGAAHYGQSVTFDVATTATARPFVSLNCYQGGSWVYAGSAGFFADYPWSKDFVLATSSTWTSGDADCTATLYSNDSRRTTNLATLAFHVQG